MWTILKFSYSSSSSSSSPQIRFRVFSFSFFVADHISGGWGIDSVAHRHPVAGEAAAQATSSLRRTAHVFAKPQPVARSILGVKVAAAKPRRSPALGETFIGARRPSKHAGKREIGEREREIGERE